MSRDDSIFFFYYLIHNCYLFYIIKKKLLYISTQYIVTDLSGDTQSPSEEPTTFPTTEPACSGSQSQLDLMMIVDSSDSVYDSEYSSWNSEISFLQYFVNPNNQSIPKDTELD